MAVSTPNFKTRTGIMTFNEYLTRAGQNQQANPEWRWGQALFNTLYEFRADLANQYRGSGLDPFYVEQNDPKIDKFLQDIKERWQSG